MAENDDWEDVGIAITREARDALLPHLNGLSIKYVISSLVRWSVSNDMDRRALMFHETTARGQVALLRDLLERAEA